MLCLWEKCECFYYSQSVMQDTEKTTVCKRSKIIIRLNYIKKENELKIFNRYMKILHTQKIKKNTQNETNYKHPPPLTKPPKPLPKKK